MSTRNSDHFRFSSVKNSSSSTPGRGGPDIGGGPAPRTAEREAIGRAGGVVAPCAGCPKAEAPPDVMPSFTATAGSSEATISPPSIGDCGAEPAASPEAYAGPEFGLERKSSVSGFMHHPLESERPDRSQPSIHDRVGNTAPRGEGGRRRGNTWTGRFPRVIRGVPRPPATAIARPEERRPWPRPNPPLAHFYAGNSRWPESPV